MRISRNLFGFIAAIFIIVAITGPFDQKSRSFIKESTERTIKFQALIAEVKIVLAGLSKVDIPFINGHSEELNKSLEEANAYLLNVSIVVFSQLMLATISQSWLFKLLLVLLFITFLWRRSGMLSAKFLIILLAINPGLAIYTSGVSYLSEQSAIDFGGNYLTKLESQVAKIKDEKSELMARHEQQRTQIRNGEKHINIFGKLKEDVTYDFKKVDDDLKGGYLQIRLLIKEAGHEMTMKVYNFCTMILFSFLLLPIGYLIIIYTIYRSSFQSVAVMMKDGEVLAGEVGKDITQLPLVVRVENALKAAWNELKSEPGKIVSDIENKAEAIDSDVHQELSNLRADFKNEIKSIKDAMNAKVSGTEKRVDQWVDQGKQKVGGLLLETENDVKSSVTAVEESIATKVSSEENKLHADAQKLGDKVKTDVSDVKSQIDEKVEAEESKVAGAIKTKIGDEESEIHTDEENLKSKVEAGVKNVEVQVDDKVKQEETQAKDKIEAAVEKDIVDKVKQKKEEISNQIKTEVDKEEGAVQSEVKAGENLSAEALKKGEDAVKSEAKDVINAGEEKVKNVEKVVSAEESKITKEVKRTIKADVDKVEGKGKAKGS